jgi:fatty-acyl-CoA synthase
VRFQGPNVISITRKCEPPTTITGELLSQITMMAGSQNQPKNLIDALAAAPGDSPFITARVGEDEQEAVTFADFLRRARAQARILRSQGLAAGDRVVIIMPQTISAMTVFVGSMMLGAVPAFLAYPNTKVEPSKYRAGLEGVTRNLKSRLVLLDENFPGEMLGHISLSHQSKVLRVSGCREWARRSDQDDEDAMCDIAIPGDALAFIQHSAGTTGLQKGVALTHASVLRQVEHLRTALGIHGDKDRIYSWLPLYHDMGLVACFMLPMVCHTELVTQTPLDWVMHPASMLEVISRHRCTLAWLPNFAFQFVARRTPRESKQQYDLSSIRALINCSEPIRASSMQEFERAFTDVGLKSGVLHTSYAMAETVFAVTQSDVNGASGPARIWADGAQFRQSHRIVPVQEKSPGSVCFVSSGRVLPEVEIRIVPEDRMGRSSEQQNVGQAEGKEVGEILIKSDCLFEGYYNRPDLTREAIVDGWYHTGDLGFILEDELYVIGRKKDLIIVGGENIYPQDIEGIVADHPAIHEGRVVALSAYNPDTGTEDIVVVAEVEDESLLTDTAAIEQALRSKVIAEMGVAVGTILLKPKKWIVKSTAGKPARSTTFEKLLREHPEFDTAAETSRP